MTEPPPTVAPPAPVAPPARMLVACLCAQWCRTCGEYRATFEAAARERPQARFVWLDVEDDSDLVGALDVDDFPTLLIAVDGAPRHFGALTPQAATLARMLDWAGRGAPASPPDPAVAELVRRLEAGDGA